ncbi:hypothetical protein N875_04150 [Neisseria meningitidis LNP21362]|uniref:Uncharacterized protein n=2 Tax=Neisseria meningitidis TaxID=487 RepID=C6SL43_NEIME|nr:hypothetical protein N875_04150 [Neisseria meningitidis LNP21362]KID53050.1 hypothetical protein N872_08285 [Neisseria meningitidis LNP27256]CBA08806.1 hypothetical protein predicted by Glimmer/Critica [Neisseria meningitidis alpha275]CCA45277.1 hypothetical protein NMALPHA522_1736 [Neisseria meningitidis alpha522]
MKVLSCRHYTEQEKKNRPKLVFKVSAGFFNII